MTSLETDERGELFRKDKQEMTSLLHAAVDLRDIDSAAAKITVQGDRYPEKLETLNGR